MYEDQSVMGLGDWIITMLVSAIPCVGFVMILVWAFGSGNENRKNYCRAMLIMSAVGIVLTVIYVMAIGGIAALSSGYY